MVKRLPVVQETWVRFLGWEDPLEKEMVIHSSTLILLYITLYIMTKKIEAEKG